ncbi:UNVERIFIED_CONTAM: hypothetical protein Sangu_2828400 [Sesamum angustifolium]|uniref:Aspartic peptidase DDI1-type domain-containing protein n=1 Tax=Sesamum angustifolium TaxID=2727405 RepID=A0AAW2IR13_9LAMI
MIPSPTPTTRVEGSPELELWCTIAELSEPQYRPPMPPPSNPKQEFGVSNESAASSVSKLESQVEKNCKKTQTKSTKRGHAQQRKPEKEVEIPQEQDDETKEDNPKVLVTRPPFPERFAKSKKDEEAKEILETFRKVEVNIPLLDAIKQIPRYARFLKELCTSKGKLKGNERAMCDLGASINVMPLSIFESLHVGPLKETGVVIQLADRSVVYPEGVLEDVLVQKFPAIDDKDYIKLALEESPMPMEEENMGVDPLVQVKKPQLPSSKKHRPMYHYHNPPDNAAGKPATAATVHRSPPSSATVIGNISLTLT